MTVRLSSLLLLAVGLPRSAAAAELPKPSMEMKLKEVSLQMRDYAFPSGLRIIFQEDHSQPIVAVTTTVDHGSSSDPVGLEGIAHCVEHLWFRSVHKDGAGKDLPKVWDILKEMGGNLNASTSDDWTNYMTVASKDNLVPLLRLESLRLKSAVEGVDDETLRVEREVIRNELRMRYENSWMSSLSSVFTALYPKGHPYERLGIGTHDSLNNITMTDVRKYVSDYYRPENTTITVVGDFDLYDTGAMLQEFRIDQLAAPGDTTGATITRVEPKIRIDFDAAAPEPPDPALPVEVKGEIVNLQHEKGAVDKPLLVLAWSTPGAYHETDFIGQLTAFYLRYAILQELYPDWEYDKEEPPASVESFGCFPWESKVASKLLCALELEDGDDPEKMTERALNGLYRMTLTDDAARRFQDYLYQLALVQQKAAIFASVDNVSQLTGRATNISAWTHFTGDPRYFTSSFNHLATIDGDRVRAYAERYLKRSRAVATLVEPYEDGDIDVTSATSAYRGARRDDTFASILTEAQAEAKVKAAVVVPDRSRIGVERLGNGMEVVAMPYSTSPLVQVAVRFPTGAGTSVEAAKALAYAAEMTRDDSYGVVDPLRFGGVESRDLGERAWTFRLTAPAGNVNDAAYVLRSRLDALIAYTDNKIGWVKAGKRSVMRWMKDPQEWADHLAYTRLLPDHPFSLWLNHADYDTLGKRGVKDVKATLAEVLRPENGTLYIVGNITSEEAGHAAKTWWSDWAGLGEAPAGWSPKTDAFAPMPAPVARQVVLVDKPETSQTNVVWRCALPAGDETMQIKERVLAEVLSDGAWLALREHTGSSYGAGANVDLRGGLAVLEQSVLVQNDQAAAAVLAFDQLAADMHRGKIDTRLVAMMKLSIAQTYGLGQQSTSQMLNRLMGVPGREAGRFDVFNTYADRLAAVKAADLPPLLDGCVGHEVVTLVGPQAVVEPQLAKAGLEAELFDIKAARVEYRAAMGLKPEKEKAPQKAAR